MATDLVKRLEYRLGLNGIQRETLIEVLEFFDVLKAEQVE